MRDPRRSLENRQHAMGKRGEFVDDLESLNFELHPGSYLCQSLQEAWSLQGPEEFTFEVLEELDVEKLTSSLNRAIQERMEYWRDALAAHRIY